MVKGKDDKYLPKINELISLLKDSITGVGVLDFNDERIRKVTKGAGSLMTCSVVSQKKLGIIQKDEYGGDLFKDWNTFARDRFEVVRIPCLVGLRWVV